MASIVRKGNCVSIVYYDPKVINPKTGQPTQIWKKTTEENALEDKLKIELELLQGTNLPKCQDTLQQFLEQWITIYGPQNWEASTHTTSESLLRNHVYPELGKENLQSITADDGAILCAAEKASPQTGKYQTRSGRYAVAVCVLSRDHSSAFALCL